MRPRGKLIVFEGPDGVGKTTLSERLAQRWQKQGLPALYYAFPGKQAGTLGHLVYRLHHEPQETGVEIVSPVSLQIMHIAAHTDAIERVLRPALLSGTHVVLDRFWWSTWVYGRDAGVDEDVLGAMIAVEKACWGELAPDAAFLLTRGEPLRIETSGERWQNLTHLYEAIAVRESVCHEVIMLQNDGAPDEALERVIAKTSKVADGAW